jgi:hypothetical protein
MEPTQKRIEYKLSFLQSMVNPIEAVPLRILVLSIPTLILVIGVFAGLDNGPWVVTAFFVLLGLALFYRFSRAPKKEAIEFGPIGISYFFEIGGEGYAYGAMPYEQLKIRSGLLDTIVVSTVFPQYAVVLPRNVISKEDLLSAIQTAGSNL